MSQNSNRLDKKLVTDCNAQIRDKKGTDHVVESPLAVTDAEEALLTVRGNSLGSRCTGSLAYKRLSEENISHSSQKDCAW